MKSEQELLGVITKIYPGLEYRIEQLFKRDADFRSLCEDYYCSVRDLDKFRKVSELENQSIKDYESVIVDLEREIFDFVFP